MMPLRAVILPTLAIWSICLLSQVGITTGWACQYCRMAALDPEAAKMAAQEHSGGFPLDATIDKFQPPAASAVLSAPPPTNSVVTSAADLPSRVHPQAVISTTPPAVSRKIDRPTPARQPTVRQSAPLRWADVGLLGLLAAGGWFCWRTRRVSAPVV